MIDLVLARPGLSKRAERHWSYVPPLGLGYLSAAARKRGISVEVVDGKMARHTSVRQTLDVILQKKPAVVGLSAMTAEFYIAGEIANALKESRTDIMTVLGGPHANAMRNKCLTEARGVDAVIVGEAENSLAEMVLAVKNSDKLDAIEGLYMRGMKRSNLGSIRPTSEVDLSMLPFPAWDLFPRSGTYPIMSDRGCPYKCVFCSHNLLRHVRSRPVESVIEEIRWLHRDFAPKCINFEDETFGLRLDRAEKLLASLIEFNKHAKIRFKAQTRVDNVSADLLALMHRAGFEYLELGVESGDPAILENSGKGIRIEQVEKAVAMAKRAGIKVWLKFIIGLPGETSETVRRTIEFAVKLNPDRLSVAIIVAYPGSKIYEWASSGEYGYRFLTKDWATFDKYLGASVELETLNYRTMRRLQILMYLETYIKNGRFRELALLLFKNHDIVLSIGRRLFSPLS